MKSPRYICLVLLILAGCQGAGIATPVDAASIDDPPPSGELEGAMQIKGMKFYTFDTRPTGDEKRKPAFLMEADTCIQNETAMWAMVGVEATIYSGDDEPITMRAGRGRFDEREGEGKEVAYLSENVEVLLGELEMHMPQIRWDNEKQEAVSNGPVTVINEGHELIAEELRIYPRENRYALKNGKGILPLAEEKKKT